MPFVTKSSIKTPIYASDLSSITGSLLSKVPAYVINTKATLCIKRLEQYNRRNSKNL